MKKYYFSLVSLLYLVVTNAQIVNIPDANFKAKLLQAGPNEMIASTSTSSDSGNVTVYSKVDTNNDGEIQVSEASVIKYLNISSAPVHSLEGISSFTNLQTLQISSIELSGLDLSSLVNLKFFYCSSSGLTSLNVNGLINLQKLGCPFNDLQTLNLSGLTSLKEVVCPHNQLTSLDLSGLINMTNVECYGNQLTSLIVNDLIHLTSLFCYNNHLTSIDISNLTYLTLLNCRVNQLTSLNVENLINLTRLLCDNNQLTTLFLKNNNVSWTTLDLGNNPNLIYICADEADIISIQQNVANLGYTNCQVNSYCNFTSGGIFYTIEGSKKIDGNNNGCDTSDVSYPYLKFTISSGVNSGTLISNATEENYSITVPAGTHTITPRFENPTYFTASPVNASVTFPSSGNPFVQNFCIVPNGVHHDLEVVFIPISNDIRPGINARYKLKYKNKGNLTENATVNLTYNDQILTYISSSLPSTQSPNTLSWNLGNLTPFQSGEIVITLAINTPLDIPPVNMGDILHYTANIDGLNTDETPEDNTATLNQLVFNSFDPNDKACLEGSVISANLIGKYVHYKIRFENTGTFAAENIVVKDIIDTTKFDISTLQLTDASHSCTTRINNTDKVEFIFENINLPFDDGNNDGYLVFKIKIKPTVLANSTISNLANIYFDYNFPVVTNTTTSSFEVLKNDTFEFDTYLTMYPNPVGEFLNLITKQDIEIYSLTVYNILGQQVQNSVNPDKKVDVSSLKTGNYIVKVMTNKGLSSSKFVKS
ncbi:T9SS type A sorting domain-containing protein [Flavobacterium sp.]|uniref:DUF7619 domain-containing protein n=1 Tax=Flavobacterium sp. TaxID=239 RepID=UPI00286C0E7C|nr:T9SS type A sorting domain-containing protein [Flavobacterium sp.]